MTHLNPDLIAKAADIIYDALDHHGHNGIDCRPDAGMDLYVTAATGDALSAVADDLRAEGAAHMIGLAKESVPSIVADGLDKPAVWRAYTAAISREGAAQALEDAADEVDSLYFGPDQHTPFTRGAALLWGAKQAAKRVRERAAKLREVTR